MPRQKKGEKGGGGSRVAVRRDHGWITVTEKINRVVRLRIDFPDVDPGRSGLSDPPLRAPLSPPLRPPAAFSISHGVVSSAGKPFAMDAMVELKSVR